jgi:hypothetical protein
MRLPIVLLNVFESVEVMRLHVTHNLPAATAVRDTNETYRVLVVDLLCGRVPLQQVIYMYWLIVGFNIDLYIYIYIYNIYIYIYMASMMVGEETAAEDSAARPTAAIAAC